MINDACDALFPTLPSYTGKPLTREDWDRLFGPCEAITDMGSFFALELIKTYPDAKVILVERDVDSWYASVEEAIIRTTWGWRADFFTCFLAPLFGGKTGLTIRKVMLGFFEARNADEMRANAKDRYRRHYAEVRAAVPPERLLNFELSGGWEPLCAFLGKPVPEAPFPVNNPRDAHLARIKQRQNAFLKMAIWIGIKKVVPWVLGLTAVTFALVYSKSKKPDLLEQLVYRAQRGFILTRGHIARLISP